MQEAYRDRVDALGFQRLCDTFDALPVERCVDRARRHDALGDLAREMPLHQWLVAVEQKIVSLGPVAAPDNVDVAGAIGDDQCGFGAGALDQRVDGGSGAVDQLVDFARGEAALVQAVDDALHQVVRRGQALGVEKTTGLAVEPDEVGKGATNVDCDGNHASLSPEGGFLLWRGQWRGDASQATGFAAK